MRRALTLTLAVALFGIMAAVVVAQVGQDPAAPAGTTGTTTEDRTTTTETTDDDGFRDDRGGDRRDDRRDDDRPGDISGPCDEAEHANDPRCAGGRERPAASGPSHWRSRHLRTVRRGRARERPALHRRRRHKG